jgi:hypothetical protein
MLLGCRKSMTFFKVPSFRQVVLVRAQWAEDECGSDTGRGKPVPPATLSTKILTWAGLIPNPDLRMTRPFTDES